MHVHHCNVTDTGLNLADRQSFHILHKHYLIPPIFIGKAKIKYMSVSGNVLKKIRVGRSENILFFHFILK